MSNGDYIRESDLYSRRVAQVIDQVGIINAGTSTGSSNAYVLNLESVTGVKAPVRLIGKQRFYFTPNFTNTGAVTVQPSTVIGAKSLKKANGTTALDPGEVISGYPTEIEWDEANAAFRLISSAYVSGTWTPTVTASGSMLASGLTTDEASYMRIGGFIFIRLSIRFTLEGVASTQIYVTTPLSNQTDDTDCRYDWNGIENGVALSAPGEWFCDTASRMRFIKRGEPNYSIGEARITMNGIIKAA